MKIIFIRVPKHQEINSDVYKDSLVFQLIRPDDDFRYFYIERGPPPTFEVTTEVILENRSSKKIRNIELQVYGFSSDQHQEVMETILSHGGLKEISDDRGNVVYTFKLPVLNARKKEIVKIKQRIAMKFFMIEDTKWGLVNEIPKSMIYVKGGEKGRLQTTRRQEIIQLAEKLQRGEIYDSIVNCIRYVQQNVRYFKNYRRLGAMFALKIRKGACDEVTDLCVSIIRAMGIPARSVIGFIIGGGGHAWLEVYSPKKGWIPVDPIFGMIGGLGVRWLKYFVEKIPGEKPLRLNKQFKNLYVALRIYVNDDRLV